MSKNLFLVSQYLERRDKIYDIKHMSDRKINI
jgi:hypothetical protein